MNLNGKGCLNCSPGPAGSAEHNPSSKLKQERTARVQKQKAHVEEAVHSSIMEGFLAGILAGAGSSGDSPTKEELRSQGLHKCMYSRRKHADPTRTHVERIGFFA